MPEFLLNRIRNIWPIILCVVYFTGDWAVTGIRLSAAEKIIDDIKTDQKRLVTREVLDLKLEPIKKDINYQRESTERIEKNMYQMQQSQQQILKALQHIPNNRTHIN